VNVDDKDLDMTPEQLVAGTARRIREIRVDRRLTQAELAHRSGVSPVTLNRIERGHQEPTLGSLARLGAVLGVEPRDLLPREGLHSMAEESIASFVELLPGDEEETARRLRRALRVLTTGE
jgi:transcriptional regulator with XRE-family HTH domain